MKRIFLTLLLAAFCSNAIHAQVAETNQNSSETSTPEIVPHMKYKALKNIYDYKDYVKTDGAKYSVGGSAVASLFIPGLGQMICNEVGRGFAWFGGAVGSTFVMSVGAGFSGAGTELGNAQMAKAGTAVCLVGLAAVLAVDICAIVDAVRVAKVKNMYENDLVKKYTFDVDLYPSVNCIETARGVQPTAGFTLAMKF